jgi:glycosyltransferase involved in cell wall biosynthesis
MKILEMIATLSPGGAEAIVADLSKHFAGRGSQVKLFLLAGVRGSRGKHLEGRLAGCGVEITGVKDRKPATFSNLANIVQCLKSWQPDIVHCHLYSSEFAYAFARAFLTGRKPIAARTLHSTDIAGPRNSLIVKRLHNVFDLNIACSDAVSTAYNAFMRQDKIDNLFTIPNGCTLSQSMTNIDRRKAARQLLGLPPDKTVIANIAGYRGTILSTSEKAHDILLKGFACAFEGQDDTILILVGDGPLRPEAEMLSRSLGIQDKVRFLGNVSEPWPVLQAADVFALPSRHEGLPLSLLEASSTALPVIASDIPEIRHISPGRSWHLFQVNDVQDLSNAMKEVILRLDEYRAEAAKDAHVIRKGYAIEECADKYLNLFASALAARKEQL